MVATCSPNLGPGNPDAISLLRAALADINMRLRNWLESFDVIKLANAFESLGGVSVRRRRASWIGQSGADGRDHR